MSYPACIALLLISANGALAQEILDPVAVLARARERLLSDLAQMPRYTCIETVTRKEYAAPARWRAPASCMDVIAERDKRKHELKLNSWDRLRLDVTTGKNGEIYSWVGAAKFEEDTLLQIAGEGAFNSGDFGPFVGAIFEVAAIKFEQEQVVNGRHLLQYSYDVPIDRSQYRIFDNQSRKWFITAYSGNFLLDRDDPDLVQLTVRTAELRPGTGRCQAINEIEYGRVAVHGNQVLIPRETRLLMIGRGDGEALNLTSYSNCREYSSTSRLRFDIPEIAGSSIARTSLALPTEFPPGLNFRWQAVTPIDSDTAAAGDPVEAVLRSSIKNKNGVLLAPSGAHIHGRLTYFGRSDQFELVLGFESIEINGTTVPFHVALASDLKSGIRLHGLKVTSLTAGGASFWFPGTHLKLTHLESSGRTALPAVKPE